MSALARVLRPVVAVIRDFVDHVVVEPVRGGRLRATRWPQGLAPVALIALGGYALAALAVVSAATVRATSDLSVSTGSVTLSLPSWTVGPLLVLVVVALALAQTAALHVPMWLAVLVTAVSSMVLIGVGANDYADGVFSPGRSAAFGASLALWILLFVRRRRRYAWGEFALVFALVTVGIGVGTWTTTHRAASYGLESGPLVLGSVMQNIGVLAYPAAVAAGAAVAQLSCSMATESVASVRRHLPVVVGAVLLSLLVLWRGWALVDSLLDGGLTPVAVAAAIVLLALIAGSWMLLARVRGTRSLPAPAALESRFAAVAQPIAALLVIGIVPATVLYTLTGILYSFTLDDAVSAPTNVLADVISDERVMWSLRLALALGLMVVAVRRARRAVDTTPELFSAIAIVIAAVSVLALSGFSWLAWSGAALTAVVTVGALVLLLVWGLGRRLTVERGATVGTALLIAALFDQRTFVEDPLRAVFGFTGLAFVLFGFVWALLTGAGAANGSSPRYPRPSRVLLFLGNALFGVTALAFASLSRDPDASIDLAAPAVVGDQLLGTGLLTAALIAALAAALLPSAAVPRPVAVMSPE